MVRSIQSDRFDALIRAATAVFLERGYRRTQMADVAAVLGVAKGTVYLYVESKEALFEQALVHADRAEPIPVPRGLPVSTPKPGSTLRKLRERIQRDARLPVLSEAIGHRSVPDVHAEVEAIVRELHRMLVAHRVAIKLLDRCIRDFPALGALWAEGGRGGVVALLEQYLQARVESGHLPRFANASVVARMALEVAVQWAVHAHWDPLPDPRFADEAAVESAVVEFVTRALCGDLP